MIAIKNERDLEKMRQYLPFPGIFYCLKHKPHDLQLR